MVTAYKLLNKIRFLPNERKAIIEKLLEDKLEPDLEDCSLSFADQCFITVNNKTYCFDYNLAKKSFLSSITKGKVKIIDSNIEELYVLVGDSYYPLYGDVLYYLVQKEFQETLGFTGQTIIPIDLNSIIKEVDSLLDKKEKVLKKPSNKLEEFRTNFDSVVFNIFKNDPTKQVSIDSKGHLRFSFEIEEGSEQSLNNINSVKVRNHNATKLDAIDGEDVFIQLMNPILKHLEINHQFLLDRKCYKNMGDNGDFCYGTKRLDIKTRQRKKADYRYNLLINQDIISKGFNEFLLVHREGDHNLTGKQRRLTILGYVPASEVECKKPIRINGGLKYEVDVEDLFDLKEFVLKVVEELTRL